MLEWTWVKIIFIPCFLVVTRKWVHDLYMISVSSAWFFLRSQCKNISVFLEIIYKVTLPFVTTDKLEHNCGPLSRWCPKDLNSESHNWIKLCRLPLSSWLSPRQSGPLTLAAGWAANWEWIRGAAAGAVPRRPGVNLLLWWTNDDAWWVKTGQVLRSMSDCSCNAYWLENIYIFNTNTPFAHEVWNWIHYQYNYIQSQAFALIFNQCVVNKLQVF